MYQVIQLYGDTEPWWFLEGWEEDIVTTELFDNREAAVAQYEHLYQQFAEKFEKHETRKEFLTAFWNTGEEIWCEECDEYLQQFQSVMLLELDSDHPDGYQKRESDSRIKPCMIK